MLIRAQECYKWLPLFSVPTELSALWISSSYHSTAYIESFVHNNECYGMACIAITDQRIKIACNIIESLLTA